MRRPLGPVAQTTYTILSPGVLHKSNMRCYVTNVQVHVVVGNPVGGLLHTPKPNQQPTETEAVECKVKQSNDQPVMIVQEVRHRISCTGVCYADDPQKRGGIWRLHLRLIQQPLFEVICGARG